MTSWLDGTFTPADFDTDLATRAEQARMDAGQEPLFATGTATRKPRHTTDRKRLAEDVALFNSTGGDTQ